MNQEYFFLQPTTHPVQGCCVVSGKKCNNQFKIRPIKVDLT